MAGNDQWSEDDLKPIPEDPPIPLNADELRWWKLLKAQTPPRTLFAPDAGALAILARTCANWEDDSTDNKKENLMIRMFEQFGMTPASRRNVRQALKSQQEDDEFDEFVNGS